MKLKEKNAISLIVLVITILVLSILATTVIISLSNTNIISQANDAVKKTEAQQIEEAKTLMYADGMLGYNPEDVVIGDTTLSWDDTSKSIQTKVDTVKIPDGFYYVGGTKETGLVISDNSADANMGVDYTCVGNQFVWVPVEYTATGVIDENGLDTGFTSVYKTGLPEETSEGSGIYHMTGDNDNSKISLTDSEGVWKGWYDNNWPWTVASSKSVCANYGFFISRFPIGSFQYSNVISFDDVYAVNDITGPAIFARDLYTQSNSACSMLCSGVMWDMMLNFVSGNYNIVEPDENVIATKNIYDLNEWQYTSEHSQSLHPVTLAYDACYTLRKCSSRSDPYYWEQDTSSYPCRVALYLK